MITKERANEVIGSTLYGSGHEKVGKVGHIFLDNETGQPEFATVRTGLFGQRESFVPLERAAADGGEVRVPYEAEQIKDAPNVDIEQGELSEQEERRLYEHYGMSYSQPGAQSQQAGTQASGSPEGATGTGTQAGAETEAGTGVGAGTAAGAVAGGAAAGGAAAGTGETATEGGTARQGSDADAMTRSEEQVRVGKETRETGRARLRKYVVTENVQRTVPVSREEVRVEREPITEENRGSAEEGPAFTESEHEVTLHEEQPVVSKEEVPVERVRLAKETQTDDAQVSEEVRKEEIEEDIPEQQRRGEEGTTR